MNILTIQSQVAYGHVGNSAAVFALQRIGCEAWPIPTVLLSNHPGYGASRGAPVDPSLIRANIEGVGAVGALARCDGVLTGYLGAAEVGEAVLDAALGVKALNPRALWCCDPVMGDNGRVYARPGVVEFLRDRAAPEADILTPNLFELELLTGAPASSLEAAAGAMRALALRGARAVVVTSFDRETPADALDTLALDATGLWRVRVSRAGRSFEGAGDLFSALFLAAYLERRAAGEALAFAAARVAGVLTRTQAEGSRELALIAAQDELVCPTLAVAAERLGPGVGEAAR